MTRAFDYPGDQPAKPPQELPKRPGAVTILGWLLLLQAVFFFGLAGLHFYWLKAELQNLPVNIPSATVIGLRGIAFSALGLLTLICAAGFFRLWSITWLTAVAIQGLSLLLALNQYFHNKPFYAYMLMATGIVMMIYLNYSEVPKAFHVDRSARDRRNLGGI
jgi:hypothetical protein